MKARNKISILSALLAQYKQVVTKRYFNMHRYDNSNLSAMAALIFIAIFSTVMFYPVIMSLPVVASACIITFTSCLPIFGSYHMWEMNKKAHKNALKDSKYAGNETNYIPLWYINKIGLRLPQLQPDATITKDASYIRFNTN